MRLPPAERLAHRADTIPLIDAFFAWAETTERKLKHRSRAAHSDASKNRWRFSRIADSVPFGGTGGSAMAGQPGFFDGDERLAWLSAAGDPLERASHVVD